MMRHPDGALTRRGFLLATSALAASGTLPGLVFANAGAAAPHASARLVVVILRGALDGLTAVPPYADPVYAGLHRELAIAPPASAMALWTSTVPSDCIPRWNFCMNATPPAN